MTTTTALIIAALLFVLAPLGLVALWGLLLPKTHRFLAERELPVKPRELYALLTDTRSTHTWWKGLTNVTPVQTVEGVETVTFHFKGGPPLQVTTREAQFPNRVVWHLKDVKGPFEATWTFAIEASEAGSRVQLTEEGGFKNPAYRAMNRLLGMTKTMDDFLKALTKKCEE